MLKKYVFTREIYAESWEKAYKAMADSIAYRTDEESVKLLFKVQEITEGAQCK